MLTLFFSLFLFQNQNSLPPRTTVSSVPIPFENWPETRALDLVSMIRDAAPPAIDRSGFTSFCDGISFLFSGDNPIQTGVEPDAVKADRASVLRGQVLDIQGNPVSEVRVTVLNHPELGQTLSDPFGLFDIAVNGGILLNLKFEKEGYLDLQRKMVTPRNQYCRVPKIVLTPRDTLATTLLSDFPSYQIARGNPCTDIDGTRQATIIVPPFTNASVQTLGNGGLQSETLESYTVRATEMTVGETGPAAMVADLPATTAYTYALDLSVDEALARDAVATRFSQDIYLYVENFIGFPVGSPIQNGYFNPRRAMWEAMQNGRVMEILAIEDGRAVLDVTGNGSPSGPTLLAAMNITDEERGVLAGLYTAGTQLQRFPIRHFSTYDTNPGNNTDGSSPGGPDGSNNNGNEDKPDCNRGSIIERQNQILGQSVPIAGSEATLNYRSNRVPGRMSENILMVGLTGSSLPEEELSKVELQVDIAGQSHIFDFDPLPNLNYQFSWDGKDAYGRDVQGSKKASVKISYVYPTTFVLYEGSFGSYPDGSSSISGEAHRETSTYRRSRTYTADLGNWDARGIGLGGWTLSYHHLYDSSSRTIYFGDGHNQSGLKDNFVITTVAGTGQDGYNGEELPALEAELDEPWDVAIHPDGSLYIADYGNGRIRKIDEDGRLVTVAGGGVSNGDGIPATEKYISNAASLEFAPDGSYYITDVSTGRIYYVDTGGILHHHAGGGESYADGIPPLQANLGNPYKTYLAPDGLLYIVIPNLNVVRRINAEGLIETVAGTGMANYRGDGGPAVRADLNGPEDVIMDRQGNLFISDNSNDCIRMVTPDGIIDTVVGTATAAYGDIPEGQNAATINIDSPSNLWIDEDDNLFYTDTWNHRVYRVDNQGILTTFAGIGDNNQTGYGFSGDRGPAVEAELWQPGGVAFSDHDQIYVADTLNNRIRIIQPPLPYDPENDVSLPSRDGTEIFTFDKNGKHLTTRDAYTGEVRYRFEYDDSGYLAAVHEFNDSRTTTITRDGDLITILGPYGHETQLVLNNSGFVEQIINPLEEIHAVTYDPFGLMLSFTDPRGITSEFTFDADGRLIEDIHPEQGTTTLSRSVPDNENKIITTLTSAEGRQIRDEIQFPDNRFKRLTTRSANDTLTVTNIFTSAWQETQTPEGSLITVRSKPDPRFGMNAPLLDLKVQTPGNLSLDFSQSRDVVLEDPNDLFSILSQTHSQTINSRTYETVFNAQELSWTTTTPEGRTAKLYTDAFQRPIQLEVPNMAVLYMFYDEHGRPLGWTQGEGNDARHVDFHYSAEDGTLAQVQTPNGSITFEMDGAERVNHVELYGGRMFSFEHDGVGNTTQITLPDGDPQCYSYTEMNQVLEAQFCPPPRGDGTSIQSHVYDNDFFLTAMHYPEDDTLSITYEPRKTRIAQVDTPLGAYTFTYDDIGLNPTGLPKSRTSPDGIRLDLTFSGSLPSGQVWSNGISGSVLFSYNQDLQLSRITTDGSFFRLTYDNDGLLKKIGDLDIQRRPDNGLSEGTSISEGEGLISDFWEINPFGEFDGYSAEFSLNGQTTNLLQQTVPIRGTDGLVYQRTFSVLGQAQSSDFQYDSAGNLTRETRDGETLFHFVYDLAGNRYPSDGHALYNEAHQLLEWNHLRYSYDPRGRLSRIEDTNSSESRQFTYDLFGNLKEVILEDGTTITYLDDAFHRRVAKTVNGVRQLELVYKDFLNPVMSTDGQGVKTRFVYGTYRHVPTYMVREGALYRLITDTLGSVRLVVRVEDGTVMQALDYDAMGRVLSDSNPGFQPFGFAGGIYDPDTGLVRFGRRDFDPTPGRFTAMDPKLFGGGELNLYTYAANDPLNFYDPKGTVTETVSRVTTKVGSWTGQGQSTYTAVTKYEFAQAGDLVGGIMRTRNINYGNTDCYKEDTAKNTARLVSDLGAGGLKKAITISENWKWLLPNLPAKEVYDQTAKPIKSGTADFLSETFNQWAAEGK